MKAGTRKKMERVSILYGRLCNELDKLDDMVWKDSEIYFHYSDTIVEFSQILKDYIQTANLERKSFDALLDQIKKGVHDD